LSESSVSLGLPAAVRGTAICRASHSASLRRRGQVASAATSSSSASWAPPGSCRSCAARASAAGSANSFFSSECEMSIARGNQLGCQCRAEVRASEIPQRAPPPRARRGRAAPGSRFQDAYRARRRARRARARARRTGAERPPPQRHPRRARASLIDRDQDKMARLLRPLTLRAARAPPGPPHRPPTRPSPPPRRAASGDPSPAPWSAAGAERRGTPSGQPKLRPNRRPRPPRAHPVPSPRSRSSSPRRGPRPPSRWTPRSR